MKKIISILMALAMIFNICVCYAESGKDDAELDSSQIFSPVGFKICYAECDFGGKAEVELITQKSFAFAAAVINVSYDVGALRLSSVSSDIFECDFSLNDKGAVITLFSLSNTEPINGKAAVLVFESVNKSGEFEISMSASAGDVCDAAGNSLGAVFKSGTVTVLCEHLYIYDHTLEATCDKRGEVVYVCKKCNTEKITYTDTIEHILGDWEVAKQAACGEDGREEQKCTVCKKVINTKKIPATSHVYGDILVDKAPTCTTDGISCKVCKICGHEEYGTISATEHKNASWKTTSPAGCEAGGTASLVCNDCGDVLETKTIGASGHIMEWVEVVPATCNKEGTKSYICIVCGHTEQSVSIEKKPHTPGEEETVSSASCTKEGEKHICCTVCGEEISKTAIEKTECVADVIKVISAPTDTKKGTGVYYCRYCKKEIKKVELEKTNAVISVGNTETFAGNTVKVPVYVKNNPEFSVGIIRVKYDVKNLIYTGTQAGTVSDITVGYPEAGSLKVLLCPDYGNISGDGIMFYLVFKVAQNASDSEIEITYDPNGDFADEDAQPVFFNMVGGTVKVNEYVLGDIDKNGSVDAGDLAVMKKMIAGIIESSYDPAADVSKDGNVDAADLALMKKYIAGLAEF